MRVMPTCFALGQAAGIAASISVEKRYNMSEVPYDILHDILKKQDVEFE